MVFVSLFNNADSQSVPEPVTNTAIYSFLDELAVEGVIDIVNTVRPYSREKIALLLKLAMADTSKLSIRQCRDLRFYMDTFQGRPEQGKVSLFFNPATATYNDSLFHITVTPLLGLEAGKVKGMDDASLIWKNGARLYGSYGNWGFFAALQDNHQDPLLGKPEYLLRNRGGHLKGSSDYSEMTAGISYSWRWADISFTRDAPVWGSGYAGTSIFSGRAPAFTHIRLHIKPAKWLEMTWFHGWLNSMVIDSTRSFWVTNAYGTDYREVYHRKYIAANIFTVTPARGLHISAGNSVIYSDPRLTPGFLLPLLFYKSADHDNSSGIDNSNSQMFIDISSYQIRHLHLYGTLFIDEMSTKRFFTPDFNFFSWKGGVRAGNFSFLRNTWFTAEATFTYPLTFQHYVPVLTFENQGYNLGHYLKDNTRSLFAAVDYYPLRGLGVRLWYEYAVRGPDYQSIGGDRIGLPYIDSKEWELKSYGADLRYLVTGGVAVTASFIWSSVTGEEDWTPPHLVGNKTRISGGIIWGF